jgi:hypothetical protein
MEKKVLIAVDDSRHSENALRYVAGIYEDGGEDEDCPVSCRTHDLPIPCG